MNRTLLAFQALATFTWVACASTTASPTGGHASAGTTESATAANPDHDQPGSRSRTIRFTYEAVLQEVPPGAKELCIWVPAPQNTPPVQEVLEEAIEAVDCPAAEVSQHAATSGPNRWWHVRIADPTGPVTLRATMTVRRSEILNNYFRGAGAAALTAEEVASFREELGPYELVPVGGRISGLAATIAPGEKNVVNVARRIYDHVLEKMKYSKDGTGWGRGDTLWACDSGYGNCTDFHSLFMSVAKARGIPTRFHMGFPIPEDRGSGKVGGYHCWAEFYAKEVGWVPVDISEADKNPALAQYYFGALTEDRIGFVTGRDLLLDPPPAAGRLNFVIYPYAELDGKPVTFERSFAYEDE